MLVDFQTRTNEFYREAVRRVHAGDIGPVVSGEAVYYASPACGYEGEPEGPRGAAPLLGPGSRPLRRHHHRAEHPRPGRGHLDHRRGPAASLRDVRQEGRGDQGDCNDHFAVIYTFPGDVLVSFASKQYGTGCDDIGCRMFGPKGMIETHYGGVAFIRGQKSYKGGRSMSLYGDGAIANIAAFHTAIAKGDYSNATVAPSVRSNLTTILGRTAAYKKAVATWDEMMKSAEKIPYDMTGLKS